MILQSHIRRMIFQHIMLLTKFKQIKSYYGIIMVHMKEKDFCIKETKKYYAKFDNIVAVSQACKKILDQKFPEIKEKIVILHNFIDDDQIG